MCKVAIICGSKVLVLKRSRLVIYHPKRWDLPGGAADPGESIEDAALRETAEEAGVSLDKESLRLVDTQSKLRDGKPAHRYCFAYTLKEEVEPKLSFEHSKFKWIEVENLDEVNLPNFYKACIRRAV